MASNRTSVPFKGTVVIRNGAKLCEGCRRRGCLRYYGTKDDGPPNKTEDYISDEPCECCELDVETNDGFGI